MSTITDPAELLSRVLMHHAQLFRGLALGYQTRALNEVDTEQRARAESMADAYEIVATTLEASALSERDEPAVSRSESAPDWRTRYPDGSEVEPDPKPEKRIKNPGALAAVHFRNDGCLLCGKTPVSVHHLLPRSLGGDDVPANLVPLCGDGVTGCHGKVERHDRDVCALLRMSIAPESIDYLVGKKSWDWLDRYYPAAPWPGEDA